MNPTRIVIDRFEDGFAVCQSLKNGDMQSVVRSRIPPGAKEGDVLIANGDTLVVDESLTAQRKAHIRKKMDGLWD